MLILSLLLDLPPRLLSTKIRVKIVANLFLTYFCELFLSIMLIGALAFGGIITDMEITSTVGELVIVSCNFVTSGTITSNLQ